MALLIVSLAPVIAILFYIYFRDKYEKEPIGILLKGFFMGAILVFPCGIFESLIAPLYVSTEVYTSALWNGFMVAGLIEESMKLLFVMVLFWTDKNFNEKFDGIVYAVFVSLGFAALENVFYVFDGGMGVGIARAFTAVPAHALFGIVMGSYIGLARFDHQRKNRYLWLAFLYPWLFHGLYDFLLMTGNILFILLVIPFMIFLIRNAFKRMKRISDESMPVGR